MKHFKKATVLSMAFALCATAVMASCTAISVKGDLVINQDGTGSRKITGVIAKGDDKGDGYGQAYYYLKKHGSALETYIESVYSTKIEGSESWLDVTVDDSSSTQETVEFSFEFTSFEDYTSKLSSLVKFGVADATYTAPTLVTNTNDSVTYTESESVLKSVYGALQTYMMNDTTVFDVDCTVNGDKTNTSASFDDLLTSGVELDKTAPMTIKLGTGAAKEVTSDGANFILTANWDGSPVGEKKTECVLNYTFNDTLDNAGTLGADGNLTLGTGSAQSSANYVEGIDGKGYGFDGASYLASPNRTYSYDEMTFSFYYKMEEYLATDTGANMVVVPAGLGALGGGVIDLEFIKEADSEGVQLLVKMNSSNWQIQDKMYTDEFITVGEWHCYTVVFENVYDGNGVVETAYLSLYIDGVRANRMELSVAAGLKYSLGMQDSTPTANGGFNVGGYYEAETVKRACKGILDNLKVFDGALSAEEVKTLCYTVPVNNGGNGGNGDSSDSSSVNGENSDKKGCGSVITGGAITVAALGAIAAAFVLKKKYSDKE